MSIGAVGQREQQDQAVFHLESGKRLYQSGRDAEAITELRRAVYLAPYQSEAHLHAGARLHAHGPLERRRRRPQDLDLERGYDRRPAGAG